MSKLTDDIKVWMEAVKKDLIRDYEQKGIKATGRWANSINYTITPFRATMYAAKYTGAIEYGRGATQKKGNGNLRELIRAWIDNKGIYPKPTVNEKGVIGKAMTKDQLSYAITNIIHKKGTKTFQTKQYPNLVGGVITDERIKSLLVIVKEFIAGSVRSEIFKINK